MPKMLLMYGIAKETSWIGKGLDMLTKEKIDELAKRFSENCGIASERYDEPKYVFAVLITMVEYLEEIRRAEKFNGLKDELTKVERKLQQLGIRLG